MDRRSFLGASSGLAIAGCAGGIGASGPPAPAPVWRVGDRWVYSAADGWRAPVTWTETHEVISMSAAGIEVRVTQLGPTVNSERIERLLSPGVVAVGAAFDNESRRFATPMIRYQFPLTPGDRWNQILQDFNETLNKEDPLNRTGAVGGWQQAVTPAGTYDAITMRVYMQVNLNDPFNFPTQCNYEIWWAPAVGAMVKETKYATYRQRGDSMSGVEFRAQNATLELTSYRRGPG